VLSRGVADDGSKVSEARVVGSVLKEIGAHQHWTEVLALARDQVHARDSRDLLKAYMVKLVDSVEVPSKTKADLIVFPGGKEGGSESPAD